MNAARKIVPVLEAPPIPRVYVCEQPACVHHGRPVEVTPRRRTRHLLQWDGDVQCSGCGHTPRRTR